MAPEENKDSSPDRGLVATEHIAIKFYTFSL